jgi:RHS repeat-associated protein
VELRKLGNDVMRQDYVYYGWSTADGQGRLRYLKSGTSSTPTSRQSLEYGYDSAGSVIQIKDYKAGGTQTQSFSYDPLDRLVSAGASGGTGGTYSETYGVDELGNLTSKGGVSYTYGTQSSSCADGSLSKPHAAVAVGSDAYCYDHNGNQTKRTIGGTTYTLTYDEENRLAGVSGGASATFVYDGDGVRIKGTVGGTTAVRRSGYGSDNNLFWLLTDHLGSTAVTLWPGGAKKAELRYKAFGETRYTSSSTPTTYRYTGQREESAIGLYFYRGRWYDVVLGRFVQADTIVPDPANPQSLNRFSYVLNNPVRYTDPTGHLEFEDDPNDVTFIVSPNRSFTGTPVGVVNPDDIASFEPSTLGETLFLGASPLLVFAGAAGAEAVLVPAAGTGWMWLLEALGFACADGDCTNEGEAGVGGLSRAAEFGIRTLRELRALSAGTALERHHIIEQRFADTLGQNALDMLGVALTPEEHQALTNAWRALIGYSNSSNPLNTLTATRQDIWLAAQEIYASYPALLEAARQQLFGG